MLSKDRLSELTDAIMKMTFNGKELQAFMNEVQTYVRLPSINWVH